MKMKPDFNLQWIRERPESCAATYFVRYVDAAEFPPSCRTWGYRRWLRELLDQDAEMDEIEVLNDLYDLWRRTAKL